MKGRHTVKKLLEAWPLGEAELLDSCGVFDSGYGIPAVAEYLDFLHSTCGGSIEEITCRLKGRSHSPGLDVLDIPLAKVEVHVKGPDVPEMFFGNLVSIISVG